MKNKLHKESGFIQAGMKGVLKFTSGYAEKSDNILKYSKVD